MVALHHHTTHTIACCQPDVLVLVLGDTAYTVVTESVVLGDIVQTVVLEVEHVHTVARTNPEQSPGVLQHLCHIVVGKLLEVGGVTGINPLFGS